MVYQYMCCNDRPQYLPETKQRQSVKMLSKYTDRIVQYFVDGKQLKPSSSMLEISISLQQKALNKNVDHQIHKTH